MSQQAIELIKKPVSNPHLFEVMSHWMSLHNDLLWGYINNIFWAIFILLAGIHLTRFIVESLSQFLITKKFDRTIVDFVVVTFRYLLLASVIVASLSKLGVQTASLVAVIGSVALAIGLALKGALADFAAGVLLIVLRPFIAGNFIEVAGTAGTVQSLQIFSCVLKTGDNKIIIIPNRAVLKGTIVNVSRKSERRIDLVVRVIYSTDLQNVKQLLEEVVIANEFVLQTPKLQIAVSELGYSSVHIVIRPWVKSTHYWPARFALNESIKNALDEAGIAIPYAQLTTHCK